jgi:hypothetical protein
MDFSEYTLVSFGDSFTFGQDTVPKYDTLDDDIRPAQKQYKIDCNNLSYTKFLSDSMGFKDSINFGVLGGSNDRSLSLLETFLRLNPTLKVFVLFNFTSASRFLLFPKLNEKLKNFDKFKGYYHCVDIIPESVDHENLFQKYSGINKESISRQYTYWRNSIQDVYNHVKDRRMIYHMLSSYNVPYVTFDGINDMDYRILRDNPTQYINELGFSDWMHNDDERYVFKEMNFLKSYCEELVDNSPVLTHLNTEDCRNLAGYIEMLGLKYNDDKSHYISEYGTHWSVEGHMKASKIIQEFINERYN